MILKLYVSSFVFKIIAKNYGTCCKPRKHSELHDLLFYHSLDAQIYAPEKILTNFLLLDVDTLTATHVLTHCTAIANHLERYYKRFITHSIQHTQNKNNALCELLDYYDLDENDYKYSAAIKQIQRSVTNINTKVQKLVPPIASKKYFRLQMTIDFTMLDTLIEDYFQKYPLYMLTANGSTRKKLRQTAQIWAYHSLGGYSVSELSKLLKIPRDKIFKNIKSFKNEFRERTLPTL